MDKKKFPSSLRSLDKIIAPLITPAIRRRKLAQAAIILDWEKVVHQFADHCVPIKLTFPYGQTLEGTLHLWVDSSAALRLEYARDIIITCINSYFGYKAVARLKFQQTSLQHLHGKKVSTPPSRPQQQFLQPIECNIDDIPSPRLQEALKNFGQALGCEIQNKKES